jgi:hypothetical protein
MVIEEISAQKGVLPFHYSSEKINALLKQLHENLYHFLEEPVIQEAFVHKTLV